MTDQDNKPLPEPPPPSGADPADSDPGAQEGTLSEELRRVRGRNKVLVAVAAVLGTLFVLLAGAGYIVYTRLSAARENIGAALGAFQEAQARQEFSGQSLPQPPGATFSGQSTLPMPVPSSTMPVSSLGFFSGGMPEGAALPGIPAAVADPAQAQRVIKAMNKYANRPIVKEFLAEMQKDPEIAAAFKASKGNNPLEMMAHIQNAKSGDRLVMKYMARPEALSLMMEVMADPDIQPLLKVMKLPGGQSIQLPQEGAPGPSPTVDTSVMGGSPPPRRARSRRPAPSVDSE